MQQEQTDKNFIINPKPMPSATTVKNRRYKKLIELRSQGFFSEDAIKLRHPLLYHNYLGKHSQRNTTQQAASCTLSQFLQKNLINLEYRERLSKQLQKQMDQEQHKDREEENEQSWQLLEQCSGQINLGREQGGDINQRMKKWQIVQQEEIQLQQQNLIDHAQQLFMQGKIDKAYINYNQIDNSSDYDQQAERDRDAQERFFSQKQQGEEEQDQKINQTYYTGVQDY